MPLYFIDTFISSEAKGSPTAVCITDGDADFQKIASDADVPVTAFVSSKPIESNLYSIRYFTRTTEIPACGHATLAAGWLMMELLSIKHLQFQTIERNLVSVQLHNGQVALNYPKYELKPVDLPETFLDSLGINEFEFSGFCTELETVFIELANPALLKSIKPDFEKLVASREDIKEVVIMSASDNSYYDFILRSFCPWIGIDEDPVTGSVHSVLGGYWSNKLGKAEMRVYQASELGGVVNVLSLSNFVMISGETKMANSTISWSSN